MTRLGKLTAASAGVSKSREWLGAGEMANADLAPSAFHRILNARGNRSSMAFIIQAHAPTSADSEVSISSIRRPSMKL